VYFWGAASGILALLRLAGVPYQATDPAVRYNRNAIAFHAAQSTLVSLLFIAAELSLAFGPISQAGAITASGPPGPWEWALIATVLFKLVGFNFFFPRWSFKKGPSDPGRRGQIPVLAPIARTIASWLSPTQDRQSRTEEAGQVTYFAGDRPFVGYGTELNAWTVVVDTSARAGGMQEFAGVAREPDPLGVGDLYQAVIDGVEALGIHSLHRSGSLFVVGTAADQEKRAAGGKFRRPPSAIAQQRLREVDGEGTHGRWYMSLQMHQPAQDVVVTMFMRFAQEGKLIFCEFSSYLLAPGLPRLYRTDRLFRINPMVYLLYASLISAVLAAVALADYAMVAAGLLMVTGGALPSWLATLFAPMLPRGIETLPSDLGEIFPVLLASSLANPLAYAYALIANATVLVFAVLAYWLLRKLFAMIALALDLRGQFGLTFSYRERFSSRSQLNYYAMQEVVRFLKMQEKILVRSILDLLRERGIDSSDFRESLTAYINQGVINSGDIRGNVISSIRSFVFRRPSRPAGSRNATRR
jgi:hypothetical protein